MKHNIPNAWLIEELLKMKRIKEEEVSQLEQLRLEDILEYIEPEEE